MISMLIITIIFTIYIIDKIVLTDLSKSINIVNDLVKEKVKNKEFNIEDIVNEIKQVDTSISRVDIVKNYDNSLCLEYVSKNLYKIAHVRLEFAN